MGKTYKSKLKFNGDWTLGEAAHHIGKKTTTKHTNQKEVILVKTNLGSVRFNNFLTLNACIDK